MTTDIKASSRFLVSRLINVFGPPNVPDTELFATEFAKAVNGFSADILQAAGDEVIRTCKFWPKPAEVIEAAERICESRASMSRAEYAATLDAQDRHWKAPDPEARARVRALMSRLDFKFKGMPEPDREDRLSAAQRDQFELMRRTSPNPHLHTLSATSKRMTGEKDE